MIPLIKFVWNGLELMLKNNNTYIQKNAVYIASLFKHILLIVGAIF